MRCRGFAAVSRFDDTDIQMPKRSTQLSAGYDFYAPETVIVPSHLREMYDIITDPWRLQSVEPFCLKTGVKSYMGDSEVLQLFIRSSIPSKLGLVLANSVGIVDADYYNNPSNEGEIGFLVYNLSRNSVKINKGDKIGQGIFTTYLKADDDLSTDVRIGGYGSTGD